MCSFPWKKLQNELNLAKSPSITLSSGLQTADIRLDAAHSSHWHQGWEIISLLTDCRCWIFFFFTPNDPPKVLLKFGNPCPIASSQGQTFIYDTEFFLSRTWLVAVGNIAVADMKAAQYFVLLPNIRMHSCIPKTWDILIMCFWQNL